LYQKPLINMVGQDLVEFSYSALVSTGFNVESSDLGEL